MPSDSAGLTLDSSGASPSIEDTGGAGTGDFSTWSKSKKTAVAGGAFGILAIGAFLYARHKTSSGSTNTGTNPVTVTGVSASQTGGMPNAGGAILAGLLGIGTGVTNLANSLSKQKAGTESIVNNYTYTTPTNPPPLLPHVNSNQYVQQVQFGQYSPTDFTKIGTVNSGVFSGTNVTGGVPVYANLFGGMQQGFNEATLPSGTDLYIPSSLVAYEAK